MHRVAECVNRLCPTEETDNGERQELVRDCELGWMDELPPVPTGRLERDAVAAPSLPVPIAPRPLVCSGLPVSFGSSSVASPSGAHAERGTPPSFAVTWSELDAQSAADVNSPDAASSAPELSLPDRIDDFLSTHAAAIFARLNVTEALGAATLEKRARRVYESIDGRLSRFARGGATGSARLDAFLHHHSDYSSAVYAQSQLFCGDEPTDLFSLQVGASRYIATRAPYSPEERSLYVEALWLHDCSASVSLVSTYDMWPTAAQPHRVWGQVDVEFLGSQAVDLPPSRVSPRVPTLWSPRRSSRALAFGGRNGWAGWNMPWSFERPNLEASLSFCQLHCDGVTRPLTLLLVRHWPDMSAIAPEQLAGLVDALESHRSAGATAVHCLAGRGRTGTFILAHALRGMRQLGDPVEEAARMLIAARIQRRDVVESACQFASVVKAVGIPA